MSCADHIRVALVEQKAEDNDAFTLFAPERPKKPHEMIAGPSAFFPAILPLAQMLPSL